MLCAGLPPSLIVCPEVLHDIHLGICKRVVRMLSRAKSLPAGWNKASINLHTFTLFRAIHDGHGRLSVPHHSDIFAAPQRPSGTELLGLLQQYAVCFQMPAGVSECDDLAWDFHVAIGLVLSATRALLYGVPPSGDEEAMLTAAFVRWQSRQDSPALSAWSATPTESLKGSLPSGTTSVRDLLETTTWSRDFSNSLDAAQLLLQQFYVVQRHFTMHHEKSKRADTLLKPYMKLHNALHIADFLRLTGNWANISAFQLERGHKKHVREVYQRVGRTADQQKRLAQFLPKAKAAERVRRVHGASLAAVAGKVHRVRPSRGCGCKIDYSLREAERFSETTLGSANPSAALKFRDALQEFVRQRSTEDSAPSVDAVLVGAMFLPSVTCCAEYSRRLAHRAAGWPVNLLPSPSPMCAWQGRRTPWLQDDGSSRPMVPVNQYRHCVYVFVEGPDGPVMESGEVVCCLTLQASALGSGDWGFVSATWVPVLLVQLHVSLARNSHQRDRLLPICGAIPVCLMNEFVVVSIHDVVSEAWVVPDKLRRRCIVDDRARHSQFQWATDENPITPDPMAFVGWRSGPLCSGSPGKS
jgi:hypothetical protein